MPRSWSRPTTTSRCRRGSTATSPPSPARVDLPILLYTVPCRTGSTSPPTRSRAGGHPKRRRDQGRDGRPGTADGDRPVDWDRLPPALGPRRDRRRLQSRWRRGCISVVSNVAPRLCADLQRACRDADFRAAAAIQAGSRPWSRRWSARPTRGRSSSPSPSCARTCPRTCACRWSRLHPGRPRRSPRPSHPSSAGCPGLPASNPSRRPARPDGARPPLAAAHP